MRTDAIDLDLSGRLVRVICESPTGMALLGSALRDHVVDQPAPPGFVVRVPKAGNSFHLLLDRSGIVLGRTRTIEECLWILGSHLAALLPPPSGTMRVRMRALLGHDSVTLAGFPLFSVPTLIERQLERVNYRIIDRLAVDLRPDAVLEASSVPWPDLADLPAALGHSPASVHPLPVTAILLPHVTAAHISTAQVVAAVSAATNEGSRTDRLDLAERLAATSVIAVAVNTPTARYEALAAPRGM